MKAKDYSRKKLRLLRALLLIPLVTILITSCEPDYRYGYDGRPGRAYLALNWELAPPEYIDAGTPDIPPYFKWGQFYRAYPGFYTLYYEGTIHNGPVHGFYAWEIDYEIWTTRGEPGGYYYNGCDGPDTYFTIFCNPNGPYTRSWMKMSEADAEITIVEDTGDIIVVMMEKNEYKMKLTYRKVEPREQLSVIRDQ